MENHNVASDNSHVDQQIGIIFGDTAFHKNEAVYHVNQGDPPDRKHVVALNHLEGGNSRFAEELLDELLRMGHATPERAYYYTLAVLSERSLNEINGEVNRKVKYAYRTCKAHAEDQWRDALEVVWRLLWHIYQEVNGPIDTDRLQSVLNRFGALPSERQAEITRHLDMILGGVIEDRLEAVDARRVLTQRMQAGRVARAWKFFQPDPAQPRWFVPASSKVEGVEWFRAWAGGCTLAFGALFLLGSLGRISAILGVLLLIAGGYLCIRHGVQQELLAIRLRSKELEYRPPAMPQSPVSPGHWVSTAFVKGIHDLVDRRFRDARPHIAGEWLTDTQGIRAHLKNRFVSLYGNAQVTPDAVNWLIRWHAERAGAKWQSGSFLDHRSLLAVPTRTIAFFRLGIAVAAAGLVALLSAGAVGATVFVGVGGFFGAQQTIAILARRRADELARTEAEQLFGDEMRAYQDWVTRLADRPSDAEMARWLAIDKWYLKTVALKRAGLTNRDLVAHVVMTEGAPGAMRARVLHGPPRYSTYVVRVFLLTESGVREIEVDLDFLNGGVHDERRNAFRYEALASASVSETGVRLANNRRFAGQTANTEPLEVERLRSRAFRLTLVSGEDITVVVENFKGLSDPVLENEAELLKIALESSGVAGALHVLEAVAAEGQDWITREQERRKRWSNDWNEGAPAHRSVGSDVVTLIADA